jgi:hypothetical protein
MQLSLDTASLSRCHGDEDITAYRACVITIQWIDSPSQDPPWEDCDGCGVVLEIDPGSAEISGNLRRLVPPDWAGDAWYYDMDASIDRAVAEQWGLPSEALASLTSSLDTPPTRLDIAKAAVELDFDYLRSWCHDEWNWLCAIVRIDVATTRGPCFARLIDGICGVEPHTAMSCADELITEAKEFIDANLPGIAELASCHVALAEARDKLQPA